jgi:hypothetical protein
METELEQEGNENAWRTADLRIRKTQVPIVLSVVEVSIFPSLVIVLSVYIRFLFLFFPS